MTTRPTSPKLDALLRDLFAATPLAIFASALREIAQSRPAAAPRRAPEQRHAPAR